MNLLDFLDRRADRRHALRLARLGQVRPLDTRLLANVIGAALISGFLGALFALFLLPIPPENEQIITYMIGQLSGFAGGIVAYHYTMSSATREHEAKSREIQEKSTENTGKLADAMKEVAKVATGGAGDAAAAAAAETAGAAVEKAGEIADEARP